MPKFVAFDDLGRPFSVSKTPPSIGSIRCGRKVGSVKSDEEISAADMRQIQIMLGRPKGAPRRRRGAGSGYTGGDGFVDLW